MEDLQVDSVAPATTTAATAESMLTCPGRPPSPAPSPSQRGEVETPVVDFSGVLKDPPAIRAGRAAAAAALEAVESRRPWTGRDERRYRLAQIVRGRCTEEHQNDRAARRLGFPTNAVALALPYNTVSESSLDARSMEQRSQDDGSTTAKALKSDRSNEDEKELKILPKCFWSMGKSFHAGKSDGYFIQMEIEHARQYSDSDNQLAQRLRRHEDNHRLPFASYGLVAWSLPLPFILGTQSGRWREDKFLALSYFLGCPIIDRTNTLNSQLGIRLINLHPVPRRNPFFNDSLDTIMLRRAREALQRCRERGNQRIFLLWSGGIDTTAMICAFLRVVEQDNDDEARQLLVVRYAERSIAEHPAFFRDVISHMKHEEILGHVRDVFDVPKNAKTGRDIPLVVTGDPADMLFGTFRMADALRGGVKKAYSLDTPWEQVVPRLLHERRLLLNATDYFTATGQPKRNLEHLFEPAASSWIAWIRPQVRAAPIPIVNMFDWWWWITYSCKYNHDVHRVFYNRQGEVSLQLRHRVFNFYESDDFHQYSFANHAQKMKNLRVWATYKHPLKEFIWSFCKDRGYAAQEIPPTPRDAPRKKLWPRLFRKSRTTTTTTASTTPTTEKIDDHTVYYLCKIKVPSVANSFGMEVGIDSDWNVIKFGAASISFSRFELEFGRGEENLLRKALLLPAGMSRYRGDQLWARGQFDQAMSSYQSATSQGLNCEDEIRSCTGALRRKSFSKDPKFKFSEDQLRHRQVRGVATHLTWQDSTTPMRPELWAYAQGGADE